MTKPTEATPKVDKAKKRKPGSQGARFSRKIGDVAARKLKAQRHVTKTIWSGLGMMGLIGWSVAIPTLVGAMVGIWLDKHFPGGRSWTLMLLVVGLTLGCFNAWRWVDKEDKEIHRRESDDDVD